jgi:hypothetical protein
MKEHTRVRLLAPSAMDMLKQNREACRAFIEHVDACPICSKTEDIADNCPACLPLYEGFMLARMRTRLYFGGVPETVLASECF